MARIDAPRANKQKLKGFCEQEEGRPLTGAGKMSVPLSSRFERLMKAKLRRSAKCYRVKAETP